MTFEEKKQRWDFVCSQFNPYEQIGAVNTFCWSDYPVDDFQSRMKRIQARYQDDFFFSDYHSIWEYTRSELPTIWANFCEDIAFCIELYSSFGDIEKAMQLLRYQEEYNLRSEQPYMRL